MKDEIGKRMKEFYEACTRIFLPRRSYTIIRVDGKAFHSYTKGFERPFDMALIEDMDATAIYLCKNIMGVKLAFVQSDEISLLLTDFETTGTQGWFGNNLQKMCSVSASFATRAFNEARLKRYGQEKMKWAEFDSRVFQIPSRIEVSNYFLWRQQDTTRNSISSVAQSLYPHKALMGKNGNELQEMIFQKNINWNDYDPTLKRGRIILKETFEKEEGVIRTIWVSKAPPIFDFNYLKTLIPSTED